MRDELDRRLAELPKDANIAQIIKVIDEWGKWTLKEFAKGEKTEHSEVITV